MRGAESRGVQARRPCDPLVLMCDDVHAVSPAGAPTLATESKVRVGVPFRRHT